MKAAERHHLKKNEFATTAIRVARALAENRNRVVGAVLVLVLLAGVAGGVTWWRKHTADQAGALLGIAIAISESRIAPASTLPGVGQAAGTFATPAARSEAAIKAFSDVVAAYPSTDAGRTATYHRAAEYLAAGRLNEAEQDFRAVTTGGASVYASAAHLGLAQTLLVAGKPDEAIKTLSDLAAQRDGALPTDAVLIQLARANVKAGKIADARAAFQRVVDEFPESSYVADAKLQLAALN